MERQFIFLCAESPYKLFFFKYLRYKCIFYFQEKLDGYKFPVYSTQSCPKNQTEWIKRSSALNCSERNGYMCLPNQNFTELLEFCYSERLIRIQEGKYTYFFKAKNLAVKHI